MLQMTAVGIVEPPTRYRVGVISNRRFKRGLSGLYLHTDQATDIESARVPCHHPLVGA
jgi:hypothetical protein